MRIKRKGIVFLVIGLFAVLLAIILCLNVSIAGKWWMAGGCVCISFDKWDMMRADKIIVEFRGETHTVTDPTLVRSLSRETLSGTYVDYCCVQQDDGWMEVYRGDRLLRRMRYISNHDAFAYEADATHWVLFGDEGHAFLSKETGDGLREIMGR